MFRRSAKRIAEQEGEIVRLGNRVERLEHVLQAVIAASDRVLIDLGAKEKARQATNAASATKTARPASAIKTAQPASATKTTSSGFAEAWTSFGATAGASASDKFFEIGAVDQRSRRWLLTPK